MTTDIHIADRTGDHIGNYQFVDVVPRIGETVGFTGRDGKWREAVVVKVVHQFRGHPSDASTVRVFVLLDVDGCEL